MDREKYNTKEFKTARRGRRSGAVKCVLSFAAAMLFLFAATGSFLLGAKLTESAASSASSEQDKPAAGRSIAHEGSITSLSAAEQSVVQVSVLTESDGSVSTGTVITEDGYILVCDHIFRALPSPEIYVTFADGTTLEAAFVGGDDRLDAAVIKVEQRGLSCLGLPIEQPQLAVGDTVYAVGFPNERSAVASASRGIISAQMQRLAAASDYPTRLIQFDASVSPGNSGGPLISYDGAVVGIVTAKLDGDGREGLGFATPVADITAKIDELIENGRVQSRPRVGMSFEFISAAAAAASRTTAGMRIKSLSDDSDLAALGYSKGDTVTAVGGRRISDLSVFFNAIEADSVQSLELTVVKSDGAERKATVRILSERGSTNYTP